MSDLKLCQYFTSLVLSTAVVVLLLGHGSSSTWESKSLGILSYRLHLKKEIELISETVCFFIYKNMKMKRIRITSLKCYL
jgi:hypothetical protein